jgi:hypothetical protein
VRLLGLTLVRIEAATAALDEAEPGEMRRLDQEARSWTNAAARLLDALAMTPTARARLGLDVVHASVARADGLAQLAAQGRETQA